MRKPLPRSPIEQQELIARVSRATNEIVQTYSRINEYLDSFDEFRASVGLAQVAVGLTDGLMSAVEEEEN